MNDQELQNFIAHLSLVHFGRPFTHEAFFNPRLRTTGGRYMLSDHRIEMNPKYLQFHGKEIFAKIILHELCHYHLHLQGKGYRHRDQDFRQLLEQVGGLRYAPSLEERHQQREVRYILTCKQCGKSYPRKKKVNILRYVCGICHGPLELNHVSST